MHFLSKIKLSTRNCSKRLRFQSNIWSSEITLFLAVSAAILAGCLRTRKSMKTNEFGLVSFLCHQVSSATNIRATVSIWILRKSLEILRKKIQIHKFVIHLITSLARYERGHTKWTYMRKRNLTSICERAKESVSWLARDFALGLFSSFVLSYVLVLNSGLLFVFGKLDADENDFAFVLQSPVGVETVWVRGSLSFSTFTVILR